MGVSPGPTPAYTYLAQAGLQTLPDGWSAVQVGQLLSHDRGISVGVMYPGEHDPLGVPLIKAGDLTDSIINVAPSFRITREKHYEYRRTELSGGEVLMTLVGDVGQCAVVPDEMAGWNAARAVAVIRLKEPSDARYVRLCLLSRPMQHLMDVWANTTVQPTLNLKEIRQLPLPWPPKPERDAIAHILGTLDDKIELNRRMNETLEAMARALFKSWFVDFDPVRAKMDGRQPAGMDAETAKLFPDRLEHREGTLIPADWQLRPILDQADLLSGGTPKTAIAEYWDGDIPWASAKDVSQCGEAFLTKTERRITEAGLNNSATRIIAPLTTVIVARGATTGRLTMFGSPIAMNQTCYGLRSKHDTPLFLYCHARNFIQQLVHSAHGSVFDTITTNTFRTSAVLLPTVDVARHFDDVTRPCFERIRNNLYERQSLVTLRDTLLPKLLSGELRVPEAERQVESAL